jgi:hypothetical protein
MMAERHLLAISLILAILYKSRRGEMIAMSIAVRKKIELLARFESCFSDRSRLLRTAVSIVLLYLPIQISNVNSKLLSMSMRSFEFFAGEFLVYVGLEGVSVTRYIGDGGIDA